jgi:ATP-binding cassette, subfamily B, bacterial
MTNPGGSVFRRGARVLWRYIRMHPVPFTAAVIGAAVFSFSLVAGTWVLGWVTDELILPAVETGDVGWDEVLVAAGAIVGLALVRAVGVVSRRYFGAMAANRTQMTLRNDVTDTYLDVPLSYHLSQPTGELLAHADADVEATTEAMFPLPFTTGIISLIAFSVIALAMLDPVLMAVGILVFPVLAIVNRIYTTRVEAPAATVQHRVGEVSNVAHESFDGALVVKTLGREDAEVARMASASDDLRDTRIEVGRLRAMFEPSIDAIPSMGTVALVVVGAWRLSEGAITPGDLVTAMALFGVLAFPMRVAGFFLEELPKSVVSAERIDKVLAARPRIAADAPATTAELPDRPLEVVAEGLTFTYPGTTMPVLEDVSLDIRPGEVVALVGPTGSGKSTLCQVLVRLVDPDAGAITVGGQPLAEVDPASLRSRTAIVFQESFLFAEHVGQNIVMSTGASDAERDAAVEIAQASRFIAALPDGFETELGERGVSLSGGQRQRVALARALIRQPRFLVLDDATSAVDPVIEARILDGLRTSLGATTLIVAHRLSTIELADRVVYLDGGRVVATGTHAELLDHPAYERLVRAYEEEAIS